MTWQLQHAFFKNAPITSIYKREMLGRWIHAKDMQLPPAAVALSCEEEEEEAAASTGVGQAHKWFNIAQGQQ